MNIYKKIHTIKISSYGWLSTKFNGSKLSWLEYLEDIENVEVIIESNEYWKREIMWIKNELKSLLFRNRIESRLLYGDFNFSNFIVNEKNKIYALDFQNVFAGDPLYDFGIMITKDDPLKLFVLKSYTSKQSRKRILLYGLRHLISMLSYSIMKSDLARFDFINSQYGHIKKEYKALFTK